MGTWSTTGLRTLKLGLMASRVPDWVLLVRARGFVTLAALSLLSEDEMLLRPDSVGVTRLMALLTGTVNAHESPAKQHV